MSTSVIPRKKWYFILTCCVFLVMIWSLYTATWETPRTTFRPAYYDSVSVRHTRTEIRADNTKVKTAADRTVKIRTNTKVFAKTRSNTDRIAKAKAPSQVLPQSNTITQRVSKIKVNRGETVTAKTQTRTDNAATAENTPTDAKARHLPPTGGIAKTQPTTGGNAKTQLTAGGIAKTQPNTGGLAKSQPTAGGNVKNQPITGDIANTRPPAGGIAKTQPTTGGMAKTQPTTGGYAKTQPTTGGNAKTQPITGGIAKTQPTTGGNVKTQPTTGGIAKSQPTTGDEAKTRTTAGGTTAGGNAKPQPTTGVKAKTQPTTIFKAWITPDVFHKSLTASYFSRENLLSLAAEYVSINEDFTWKPSDIHYLNDTEGPCWKDEKSTLGVLCLPKLYLAGFSKCGTTDLWYKLKSHKRLYRKGNGAKEPHWWNMARLWPPLWGRDISRKFEIEQPKTTMRMYLDYMTHDPTKGIIDASSGGLTDNLDLNRQLDLSKWIRPPSPELKYALQDLQLTSVHLIYQYTPQAKYILILRDPVQRLYSDYLFAYWKWPSLRNRKPSQADFHKLVEDAVIGFRQCLGGGHNVRFCSYTAKINMISLYKGLYVTYIYDLLKIIKRENLQVVHFDEYTKNRTKILEGLFEFLQVGPDPETLEKISQEEKIENGRKEHDNDIGEMWPQTKKILKEFHEPFNEELARLLDDQRWLFV